MSRPRLLVLALFATACATDDSKSSADDSAAGDAPAAPTWSGEVRGIVAANCTSCHVEGGSSPFPLQTHDQVAPLRDAALAAIQDGRMPPWLPADDCAPLDGARRMSDADIATFAAWVDAGAPEGEPTAPIEVELPELDPDLVGLPAEAFTPAFDSADDEYHCFVLDLDFPEDVTISASQVVPGSEAVHHVLVYALEGIQIDQMLAADAAEEGPGYTCFGGPLPSEDGEEGSVVASGFPNQIAAWVPGAAPVVYGDDTGVRVTAGSQVVMQVHYSATAAGPAPDQSRLELELHDTPPAKLVTTGPLAIPELDIPAGEAEVSFEALVPYWGEDPVTVTAMAGHMHMLGQRIALEVVRADGAEECALDIPDWDFLWQQSYSLPEEAPLVVHPGESLRLTCTYDNSADNQPVVDGAQQEPQDVEWGDGSLDEMCLMYLSVEADFAPVAPAPETACDGSEACLADCEGDALDCLLTCPEVDVGCLSCAVEAIEECGLASCLLPLAAEEEHLTACALGEIGLSARVGTCLDHEMGDSIGDLAACAQPTIEAGSCDAPLAACGVAL